MRVRLRIAHLLSAGVDRTGSTLRTSPLAGWLELISAIVLGGVIYGAAMGTFGGFAGDRIWQILYSSVKLPLLLLLTTMLSLPGFCVVNTLAGLRHDLSQALQALFRSQAASAIVLASLAPYPIFWYASSDSYHRATVFNSVMFLVASIAGQVVLRRLYAPLIQSDSRHRVLLRIWLILYCFTGIQMAWVLRPFLGSRHEPVQFFRNDGWANAYVIVAQLIWRTMLGR